MRGLLLFLALMLLPATASATQRVWIHELAAMPTASTGVSMQMGRLPVVAKQQVDITAGVQTSAAFNAATRFIRVVCEVQCAVALNATATVTDVLLPALTPEYFGVPAGAGATLSVIAAP